MRKTLSGVIIAIVAAAGGALLATWATPLSGQAPAAYRAPRRADGHPDLNGIWQANTEANFDLEAHMARPALGAARRPLRPGAGGGRPRARRGRLGASRHGRRGRRADSVQAGSARQEKREPGEVAGARSRDQVLPARRAARDLHAAAVPDSPEQQRDLLRVSVRRRGAQRLPEGSRARRRSTRGWASRSRKWEGDTLVIDASPASTTAPGSIAPATSTASS